MVPITILRQSAAELLAYAITDIFPGVLLVEGKATEFGFYYDFIAEQPIDENAIVLIEEKMRGLVKQKIAVRTLEMMRENAAVMFEHREQPVKARMISEALDNIVTIVQINDFHDYCPPPYIENTGEIIAFKILKIEPVTRYLPENGEIDVIRIRGAVFPELDHLKKYVKSIKSAKKVDHRLIGKTLDLYAQHDDASTLSWFWHPNGAKLRQALYDMWQEAHRKQHFEFLVSPSLVKKSLIKKAGLFDIAPETIDSPACTIEDVEYMLPPSLTPSHAQVFKAKLHSYRELPVRYAECAQVSALGPNPSLWGMLNNRMVYSDFAHIFCTPVQVEEEIISSLHFIDQFVKILGFENHWCLGGRSQKFAGTLKQWKKSHESFVKAFEASGLSYTYCEQETAYAGPFAEARLVDAIGREWKGPQIGIDFNSPQRFGLRYQGPDDEMHTPVLLVRTLYGSFERFTAILVEHFAGQFPVWLAPEQVRVIPVLEKNMTYAGEVCKVIEAGGYRATVDYRHEQLGSKIHAAENENIPYMVIVGDKEEKQKLITVRSRGQEKAGAAITVDEFLTQLCREVTSKSLPERTPRR